MQLDAPVVFFIANGPVLCRRNTLPTELSDRSVCLCHAFFDWKMILMSLLGIIHLGTVIHHPHCHLHPACSSQGLEPQHVEGTHEVFRHYLRLDSTLV
jgi:hypothetical protein